MPPPDKAFLFEQVVELADLPPGKDTENGFFTKIQLEKLVLYLQMTNTELKKMRRALNLQDDQDS